MKTAMREKGGQTVMGGGGRLGVGVDLTYFPEQGIPL